MRNIRDEIVDRRRERIRREGHCLGATVPAERESPLSDFLTPPRLVCEVKRRSPSRGNIAEGLNPVKLADTYVSHGVASISVLTEEDYFHGSLDDLMAIKRAHPQAALLRKDFLLDEEDIRVSYRAGADAVLLIASVLIEEQLAAMVDEAQRLGMTPLVELHDETDVRKAEPVKPAYIGINSRNLSTFEVDLLGPLGLHEKVNWNHTAIFESGIYTCEDARLVATSGFDGILVGEAVVREPWRIVDITAGLTEPGSGPAFMHPEADFWRKLSVRTRERCGGSSSGNNRPDRPLVKICGITNRADAEAATELGADILGFVFAESPRRATYDLVRELRDLPVLKVAVVVSGGSHGSLQREVADLLSEGAIDAVQFHGDETPAECSASAYPYYRALRVETEEDLARARRFACPRVLLDARVPGTYGGTGTRLSSELLDVAVELGPLWIAGGLDDANIGELLARFRPELVDASSRLEASPGRKDHRKLKRFFEEIGNA